MISEEQESPYIVESFKSTAMGNIPQIKRSTSSTSNRGNNETPAFNKKKTVTENLEGDKPSDKREEEPS